MDCLQRVVFSKATDYRALLKWDELYRNDERLARMVFLVSEESRLQWVMKAQYDSPAR